MKLKKILTELFDSSFPIRGDYQGGPKNVKYYFSTPEYDYLVCFNGKQGGGDGLDVEIVFGVIDKGDESCKDLNFDFQTGEGISSKVASTLVSAILEYNDKYKDNDKVNINQYVIEGMDLPGEDYDDTKKSELYYTAIDTIFGRINDEDEDDNGDEDENRMEYELKKDGRFVYLKIFN